MSEAEVADNKLWYYYDRMASPIFANHNPFYPHVLIRKGIQTKAIELHEVWYLEHMHASSPSLIESQSAAKKTKQKKRTLKKAVPATTSTADPPPSPVDFSSDDVPLVELPIPLPFGAPTAE